MSKYKGQHGGKKGQKIRAGVSPPPISGNAQKKTFFFREGFPNTVLCKKKQAIEDYKSRENYSLSFKRGDIIKILKEHLGWAIGRKGEEFGYFPLKYVVAFQG